MSIQGASVRQEVDLIKKVKNIKLFILDVDGVMTDGCLYFDSYGEKLKVFHVHDGYGIQSLISSGCIVSIISGRQSEMVANRARELGIVSIFQGQKEKLSAYQSILSQYNVVDNQVACMGDDCPDAVLMQRVGLSFAPADAHHSILKIATIVTSAFGGRGAVREACDILLNGLVGSYY